MVHVLIKRIKNKFKKRQIKCDKKYHIAIAAWVIFEEKLLINYL